MINVEQEFDKCVRQCGGFKVSDKVGAAPGFKNADYLFDEYAVVAELKCLQEDQIKSVSIRIKASEIYQKYRNEEKAPVVVFGTERISTEGFPEEFAKEISELYRKPVRDVLKKANRYEKLSCTSICKAQTGF